MIVPCYNEEQVIRETHARLTGVLGQLEPLRFEIIYVDDGSRDRTPLILGELQALDERVRGVEVVLDLLDQRADPDDLRPQRERRQEEPREGGNGAACTACAQRPEPGGLVTRLRAIRANASTCLRASRPATAGGPERIASRIGT